MLPEYFILFDAKFTCENNIYEIINLHALKINYKNNNLIIIDKFDYYIKPIINPILSIQTIHNTNITKQSRTPFAVAISDNCECRKNPEFHKLSTLEKYKEYIRKDKPFATWTRTKNPAWY